MSEVTPTLVSTDALILVVQALKQPNPAVLNRYFPSIAQDPSEEIHFDIIKSKRRLAPFVSPLVAGKPVTSLGMRTATFRPAYVKPKSAIDPNRPFKRLAGERIGGELSPQERLDAHLAATLADHADMIVRRQEVMAVEALRTGKVTVSGDDYPTVVVDFQRDASLSPAALSGAARWDQTTANPLRDLNTKAKIVRQLSGTNPSDVIMGEDAYAEFIDNDKVMAKLDNRNITDISQAIGITDVDGLTFHGMFAGYRIFSYAGWYVDPADDTEKEIFPGNEIVLCSAGIEGVRFFGAIKDAKAGYRALPMFPKMWEEDDPSQIFLMTQSAPMVVPTRVDASLNLQVLDA